MFAGLAPVLVLALTLGGAAHAQEDPSRPLGACGDVRPRDATQSRLTVTFGYGTAQLDPISAPALEWVADQVKDGRQLCIEVHTASRGDPASNLTLSRSRAQALTAALAQRYVPAGTVPVYGRGEAEPIDPDDRTNQRVVAWAWRVAPLSPQVTGPAPTPVEVTTGASATQNERWEDAVDVLLARLPARADDPDVLAAVKELGPSVLATFGETYERRFLRPGVGLVTARDGTIERVRLYGRLAGERRNGVMVEAPSWLVDLDGTWTGLLPRGLHWGDDARAIVADLGDAAECQPYGVDLHALVYPGRGLTLVMQPYTSAGRADCNGRLAVVEYRLLPARAEPPVSIDQLADLPGRDADEPDVADLLSGLGAYTRAGQPPAWVFREHGVELLTYDGLVRGVDVFAQVPGMPALHGLRPWQGAAPHGLAWGATPEQVARALKLPQLACDYAPRALGGETRVAAVGTREQALFLLDAVVHDDPTAVRTRAPRGTCTGGRLIGWRFASSDSP